MKHRINDPVCRRKFKADCHRTNNLGDRKWADKFGSKPITDASDRNILRRKPHFLTHGVDGRLRPVVIGLNLGARPHLDEGLSGPTPGATAPLDKGVGRGNRDFGLHTRKKWWLVP